jgi:signal transduction histidine kinase
MEVREALASAANDNDRASTVVGRIRALIQKAPTRIDSVNVNEAVREVIELTYGEALKNRVSVRTQLTDGLPLIQGDGGQLQQVVLNLILNAVQAMGAVTDGTREVLITTSQAKPNEVCLGVQDTGPGLSPESFPRLFEPFYTTKPEGMGLSICRSIIEAHGGRLWATPCEPQGASFSLRSPLTELSVIDVAFWHIASAIAARRHVRSWGVNREVTGSQRKRRDWTRRRHARFLPVRYSWLWGGLPLRR